VQPCLLITLERSNRGFNKIGILMNLPHSLGTVRAHRALKLSLFRVPVSKFKAHIVDTHITQQGHGLIHLPEASRVSFLRNQRSLSAASRLSTQTESPPISRECYRLHTACILHCAELIESDVVHKKPYLINVQPSKTQRKNFSNLLNRQKI
jgi:hypothetical protein